MKSSNDDIPYIKWRRSVCAHTGDDDCRIGDDLLVLQHTHRSDFMAGPFRLDMTLAVFMRRGSCRFMADMGMHTASAPCFWVVLPGQIFQAEEFSDDMDSCTLIMSESFTDGLFNDGTSSMLRTSISEHPVMDLTGKFAVFDTGLAMLADLVRSQTCAFGLEAVRHLMLAMFYGYSAELHEIECFVPQSSREALFRRFVNELKANLCREREVAFYASRLCVTPKYLSAVVKTVVGKGAREFIDDHVATECKALLLSTDMSVQQIADRLNFPSQSVFGKFFKRVTGTSPSLFRRRAGRKDD